MRFRIIAFFLLLPILAMGQGREAAIQTSSKIDYYLKLYSQTDAQEPSTQRVLSFVEKLEGKRESFKREKDFLEFVFIKTHQLFLKRYADYPSFGEILNSGTYNCLTGTALYALILDHFGIDYQIIETNYHIFLMAQTEQGNILFEATDPVNGFVSDAGAIENRIEQYKENRNQKKNSGKTYYLYDFDLFNEVNLDQVVGLLHYNLSISAYNEQQLTSSVIELNKAIELYQSPRIQAFSQLILLAVLDSDLDPATKEKNLQIIHAIRNQQSSPTASAN